MKETRDIGFMFLAMAIGMATGTKFYLLAIIFTVIIALIIFLMNRFNRYAHKTSSQILKIQLDTTTDFDHLFDAVFVKYTTLSDLISVDSVRGGALTELVYNIDLRQENKKQEFLAEIKNLNKNLKVTLITGYNTTDL